MLLWKRVDLSSFFWLFGVLILVLPAPTFATLGENENSVQKDQSQMRTSARITRASTHTVHELTTPAGHVIREYVSPSGTVFGVSWEGPSKPDLRQLLGSHWDEFIQASDQLQRRGRGPLLIQLPDLVVVSAGHMRAFSGKAYLPQAMPSGVRAEDIQ